MVEVGESLGTLVNSQKRQLELGIRKSMDLVQMVKRYHQRWNSIRNVIEKRRADIEAAMVKYDPANLGVEREYRRKTRFAATNGPPVVKNLSPRRP